MTGLNRVGSSKWIHGRPPSPISTDSYNKCPFRQNILLHPNDMAEPAQPQDINTPHSVHVFEELLQLTIESNAGITANSHCTEDLT